MSLSAAPPLSVIVPHRGAVAELAGCFAALARQSAPAEEIVVAVNNDADDTAAVMALGAAAGLAVRAVHAAERGAGPARNAAIAASTGVLLALIDSDCRPAADWLAAARRALQRHRVVGGGIEVIAADPARPTAIEGFDMLFGLDPAKFLRRAGHLLTPNMLVSRADFDRVGPFRNHLPEDKEWCWRAVAAGLPLSYAAEVLVVHPALGDWSAMRRRWCRITTEEHALARERHTVPRFWARSWLILASTLPHACTALTARAIPPKTRPGVVAVLARVRFLRFWLAQRLVLRGLTAFGPGGSA